MTTETKPTAEALHRSCVRAAATVGGVLALLVVTLLMLLDKTHVDAQQEVGHVAFGMPLNWVVQDQGLDPPLPYDARFRSPWENPTIDWLPLVLDVVVVALVLAGVRRVVLGVRSGPSAT